MFTLRQKVAWFAVSSRLGIFLLSCISNALIPDHEADDVFLRPLPQSSGLSFGDKLIQIAFGGLERWDAHYFLHVAENGYVYENSLAFFPLFPTAIRFISSCLKVFMGGLLSNQSLLLLASSSLNMICFVKAADVLFCLSKKVLEDEILAYKAALLFCINPASIFFTAPYSEALFALLSFQGMRHSLDNQYSKLCAIPFGLAAAARSNGILNIGFILHSRIQEFLEQEWCQMAKTVGKKKLLIPFKALPSLCRVMESCIIALAPFVAYQVYCYVLFCTPQKLNAPKHVTQYGHEKGLVQPEFTENLKRAAQHWCNFKLPLAYSYVQDHYWNVGFLRYYEWKQTPNFLLATPMIFLILLCSKNYFYQNRSLILHLGFTNLNTKRKHSKSSHMSPKMFVFVVHVVFLTLFSMAFIHIQVITRMICSSSPVPYWYAAYIMNYNSKRGPKRDRDGKMLIRNQLQSVNAKKIDQGLSTPLVESLENMHSRWRVLVISEKPNLKGKIILLYFVSYALLGTVLFSNFLPWT